MKIDIDKFICDFISFEYKMDEDESPFKDWSRNQRKLIIGYFWLLAKDIKQSLRKQGLEYKDGELVEIEEQKPLTEEQKAYIDEGLMNGSMVRESDITYADESKPSTTKFDEEPVDVDAMIDAYEKRLVSQANGVSGSPLVTMCLTSYKHGIQDTLSEQKLSNIERIRENGKEPDFDTMEAEYCSTLDVPNGTLDSMIQLKMCSAYRKGLEDMYRLLKG